MTHQVIRLRFGDSIEVLKNFDPGTLAAVITDPPYGLEFMLKDWDAPWKTGAGMTKPGLGDRSIPWPSHGGLTLFGGANPTCATCGGRARGAKKCGCDEPDWRVKGKSIRRSPDVRQPGGAGYTNTSVGPFKRAKVRHSSSPSYGGSVGPQFQAWCVQWLTEARRVIAPGGVIKAFGGTRMFHRLAMAMEETGFENISIEAWCFGSGFPKSLSVHKALKKAIALRYGTRTCHCLGTSAPFRGTQVCGPSPHPQLDSTRPRRVILDGEAGWGNSVARICTWCGLPDAEWLDSFSGFGTALKPAWEPLVVGVVPK